MESLLYRIIDELLVKVINMAGWPIWHGPGGGDEAPAQTRCDFGQNKKWCARLDFRRGLPEGDLTNEKWNEMLSHLPLYEKVLAAQQNLSSEEGKGQRHGDGSGACVHLLR